MPARLTTEEFVEKSKRRYGESALDYSKCTYRGGRKRVTLICNKHHCEFTVEPNSHLTRNNGCPFCGKEATHTKQSLGLKGFIDRSKAKFGDRFDYSEVVYRSLSQKVRLFCKEHEGFINILPHAHFNSDIGCPVCSRRQQGIKRRITKEEFVSRAKDKYGDRFDYGDLVFVDYQTPTSFVCKEHGECRVSPMYHLLLKFGGCSGCAHYAHLKASGKMTTEEFIEKLRPIFHDSYDYSKMDYFSYKKKVFVRCKKHDLEFTRLPQTLLNGVGSPKCIQEETEGYERRKENALNKRREFWEKVARKREIGERIRSQQKAGVRYGKEKFLELAKIVHGDDFSYDKVEFVNMTTPVIIHCNHHDYDFRQTPQKHIGGQGCPKCIGRHRTTEDFIREATEVHGDRFDYSKTVYKGCSHKVEILCKKHNKHFSILPIEHLEGGGCPECCKSSLELRLITYLAENTDYTILTQHQFGWLKTTRTMPLDIFIPELNIAIECQGIQHFIPRLSFGGEKVFKQQQEKDKLKYDLCKEHGIEIVYFVDKKYLSVMADYFGKIFAKETELLEYLSQISH